MTQPQRPFVDNQDVPLAPVLQLPVRQPAPDRTRNSYGLKELMTGDLGPIFGFIAWLIPSVIRWAKAAWRVVCATWDGIDTLGKRMDAAHKQFRWLKWAVWGVVLVVVFVVTMIVTYYKR